MDGQDLPLNLTVKRISTYVPVSVEQLVDAGVPLPPGVEPPPAPARLPRLMRWRMQLGWSLWSLRQRVGFWIAGYEPDDEDW